MREIDGGLFPTEYRCVFVKLNLAALLVSF